MKTLTKLLRIMLPAICSLLWLSGTQAQAPLYTVTFNIPLPFATITFAGITNPMGNYVFPPVPEGFYYYQIEMPGLNPASGEVFINEHITVDFILPDPYPYHIMKLLDAESSGGEEINVDLYIYNYNEFVSFQADILFPEGFGWIPGQVELNPERITDHVISGHFLVGTNIYRIISYSPTNAAYLGEAGVIASFSFGLSAPPLADTITLNIENAIMANIEGENIVDWAFPGLVIPAQSNLPGDSNCDGTVNVQDVIITIQYTLGAGVEPFCFENADVNQDGLINVNDVVGTLNIILAY